MLSSDERYNKNMEKEGQIKIEEFINNKNEITLITVIDIT